MRNGAMYGIFQGKLFACAMAAVALTCPSYAGTVRADGFLKRDVRDDAEAIQKAIDSGAEKVVISRKDGPWIVARPLIGRSNLHLVFEKGVEVQAKRGEFKDRIDCLFRFDCCTNVTLSGYAAVLKMHRNDYLQPPYRKSEWRHGLSFLSCRNVKVEGLTITETGGDGIYIGVSRIKGTERACVDVVIKDVTCERNNRQGISVISAENLLIENCGLHRTCGMSPEAGIDFEPNSADQRLVNCRMRNCRMYGNMGSGVEFWLTNLDGSSAPVSVLVEDCETESNHEEIRFRDAPRTFGSRTSLPRGTITLRNCTFRNMRKEYIYAAHETDRGISLRMEKCSFIDDPNPARRALSKVTECIDDAPGMMKPVPTVMQTGWIDCAVYADRARTVKMRVKMTKAERVPMRNGKPVKGVSVARSLDVLDASGKKVAEVGLMPADQGGEADWSIDLPAAGIYTFGGFANRGFYIRESDAPVAVDVTKRGHTFHKVEADLYAYVPKGTERIVATAASGNRRHRMGLAVYDPSDGLQSKGAWIEGSERYIYRNPAEGWWRFELRKPHVGDFWNSGFDVIGAHGYLFPDKNRMWR